MDKSYFDYKGKDNKAIIMAGTVGYAIADFCEQNHEFEQAVAQSGKSFDDCMASVASGVGSAISDLDAVKKAVKFYFSTADVSFKMLLDLGDGETGEPVKDDKLEFTLDDLF